MVVKQEDRTMACAHCGIQETGPASRVISKADKHELRHAGHVMVLVTA